MKKFYFLVLAAMLYAASMQAQDSYLDTAGGFVATDVVADQDMFSCFDVYDNRLYGNDGNSIKIFDLESEAQIAAFATPADYNAYPSFIKVSANGNEVWAGFTVYQNTDDRIYRYDLTTGEWHQEAILAGNFDLEFFNNQLLVSALGDSAENQIFILDTSSMQQHRPVISTGGNSSGFTIDDQGNLYYTTYFFSSDNCLVSWNKQDVVNVLQDTSANALSMQHSDTLTMFTGGGADVDIDIEGVLAFAYNDYSAGKVLAKWNGQMGPDMNYDTIALASGASDWFVSVDAVGKILDPGEFNGLFALSYARPIAKVNGTDHAPILVEPFEDVQIPLPAENMTISLASHFTDPDSENDFSYTASSNNVAVADVSIESDQLHLTISASGQATISVEATNDGRSITTHFYTGVYPEITGQYTVSDFESLGLGSNDYWNGSDGSGGFTSGLLNFPNSYNPDYGSWSEWAYSTMENDTTPGYGNQYSAITAAGFDTINSEGSTYGVSFASDLPVLTFDDGKAHQVKGFYVTNNTYAALAMKNGDTFSKKFGGVTGDDPDWFKLSVWGYYEEAQTDTVDFYLADYRFADGSKDYIIQTWQWIDLDTLGFVDSLQMALSSSDVGQWGMNTPAYYCADNFYVGQAEVGIEAQTSIDSDFSVYPNPAKEMITVSGQLNETFSLTLYDYTGKVMHQISDAVNGRQINLAAYPEGIYILKIQTGQHILTRRIVKQ